MRPRRAPRARRSGARRAGDEEHGEHDGDEDEAGAEVGLQHDQRRPGRARASSVARRSVPLVQPARPGRPGRPEIARMSRTLPSSEAWKEKNGSAIARREPRATRAEHASQQDRGDQKRVEAVLELAQARVVDPGQAVASSDPDPEVDGLALDEEVRLRRGRRPAWRRGASTSEHTHRPMHGQGQDRVERQARARERAVTSRGGEPGGPAHR